MQFTVRKEKGEEGHDLVEVYSSVGINSSIEL